MSRSKKYILSNDKILKIEASGGAGAQSVTIKPTGCGFDPLEEMKYLLKFIFSFLRSDVERNRGVEFCHSIHNASRIQQKGGNGVSLHKVPSAYPAVCGIQREADLFIFYCHVRCECYEEKSLVSSFVYVVAGNYYCKFVIFIKKYLF